MSRVVSFPGISNRANILLQRCRRLELASTGANINQVMSNRLFQLSLGTRFKSFLTCSGLLKLPSLLLSRNSFRASGLAPSDSPSGVNRPTIIWRKARPCHLPFHWPRVLEGLSLNSTGHSRTLQDNTDAPGCAHEKLNLGDRLNLNHL
jgi:hypothetical protein